MTAIIKLPPPLGARLSALRRRVRLIGAVRGLAWTAIVLSLSAAAAVGLDYWFDLPAAVRHFLFQFWLGEGAVLATLSIVLSMCRRIAPAAIAAAIEAKYPDLGERLTSAVELTENSEPGHGSPVFIGLLLEEAARRSQPLDFQPVVSPRRALWAVGTAAALLALGILAAFVWPRKFDERTQRFLSPWRVEMPTHKYDIAVSPGDTAAARGQALTLSARILSVDEESSPLETATLVVEDPQGAAMRYSMDHDTDGNFSFAYKVAGDVSYRVEAGDAVSASYRVTAVTPVELAADSPRIIVVPPQYARAVKEEETFTGLVDLSPLQYSEVRLDFRFTRPAVSGVIEWMPEGRSENNNEGKVERQTLQLSDGGRAANLRFTAIRDARYRLLLEAEHGVLTELVGGTIRVVPDRPPSVVRFAGKEELRSVLPTDRIPLEIEAADDFCVADVELEYRVNDGESKREALKPEGGNTQSVVARTVLDLKGKIREGERLEYRFHLRDNLPKEYQGPHVVVYPADRWLMMQAARQGDPLKQQEILAQRDEINRRLQAVRESVLREKRGVYKVRQETRDEDQMTSDQVERVNELKRENQGSEKALQEIAEIAETSPPLQPVAERVRATAEGEMRQSEQALEQAPQQKMPLERTRRFDKADEQLDAALKRLDDVKATNDRLAQERLDRMKLEALAERENRLAERAAELAKQPAPDPEGRKLAENLQREQAETAAELERLGQQSEPIKQAIERARQEKAEQLAERARRLAQDQRDLMRAESETERRQRLDRLAELARRQQQLADQQEKLAQRSRDALEVARTPPLKPEESRKAAEDLKQDNATEASRRQEQAANDLERLAQAFERALAASSDPKEAARQLAEAENVLRQRAREETRDNKPLIEEQNAIRQAAARLSVPPDDAEANALKRNIDERATRAEEALRKQNASQAQADMEETKNLLQRLSDRLPSLEQRRQKALHELQGLRQQQEAIAHQVERLPKEEATAKERMAEAARSQMESVKRLHATDTPTQEDRRERAEQALRRALADLREGKQEDIDSSQREAKRQLERLERALRGEKPADEQARDLARRQRELAEEAKRGDEGANPAQRKEEIKNKQQRIAQETANLPGDAPQRQREAAEAAQRAATAAGTNPTAPETQKQMEEASRKLEALARQLAGEESDAAKAERLARAQADAVSEIEQQPDKAASAEGQRRQQEIAREAREIHGGETASQEKKRVLESLNNIEQSPAQDQVQARRRAADALRDLADRLAGRSDAADKASRLAREQRALADEVAADKLDNNAAGRQAELARQLRRLDGRKALPQIVETRARMGDAAVALTRAKKPSDAKQAVARAADAADRLAEKLAATATAKRPTAPLETPDTGSPRATAPANSSPMPSGMPSRALSEQARQLAQQQRELRDRVQRLNQTENDERPALLDNPVEDLVRQQAAVAKETEELARDVAQEQGDKTPAARQAGQARQTTAEATRQLVAGALPSALSAGEQSADRLRQLASQLVSLPRGVENQTKDVLQQARRLSQRQEQINRLLQPLANDPRAQAARQQARQRQLEGETADLMRQFQDAAQKPGTPKSMNSAMRVAGDMSGRASQAMRQAGEQSKRGESSAEKASQEGAASALDRAARAAAGAARSASAKSEQGSPKAGEAMTQAAGQMAAAQGQLSQGNTGQAQAAMKQAAQSLAQAAGQMAAGEQKQSGQPTASSQSSGGGAQSGGLPNLSAYGLDSAAYAGKSWGELPGELRTKIVQDVRANYGDDYARMIKYYFEHLADTRKK